jgi:ABC-type transporter MlaC component
LNNKGNEVLFRKLEFEIMNTIQNSSKQSMSDIKAKVRNQLESYVSKKLIARYKLNENIKDLKGEAVATSFQILLEDHAKNGWTITLAAKY